MKDEVKVNLGSGPDGVEGWINYDWGWLPLLSRLSIVRRCLITLGLLDKKYDRYWPKVRLKDLRKGIPLLNETVDWIYNSNFLEHLEPREAEGLLKESFRVLKKGGRMRLVVPDLEKLVKNYIKKNDGLEFNREFYGFDKDLMGVTARFVRGHVWMYDKKMIIDLLNRVGFKNVRVRSFGKSDMPDVKKLDLKNHRKLGLYVEVKKD